MEDTTRHSGRAVALMEDGTRQSSSAPNPLRVHGDLPEAPDVRDVPRSKFQAEPTIGSDTHVAQLNAEQNSIVHVKNLPCKVGCQRMMLELRSLGFDGCYDFMHIPMKASHGKDSYVGYGFIHFLRDDYALRFMDMFQNHSFSDIRSEKVVQVELAHEQDLSAKIAECRRVMNRKPASCMFDPTGLKAPVSSS
eukprot:TRINITY_DN64851_c0_g1_i1.p1 TRINITY_DN64851_c0_g1~~TRINITY_DN64851_c0_g1_i1.p1  ORF type:complete len:193 (+),score=23.83 TRINITY_DN64851_c0_g1_i1:65-643(+)